MRLSRLSLVLAPFLLLVACSETPRCVDRGTPDRPRIVIECNAGKVPVCGNDPDLLYGSSGALLPVPTEAESASGSCDGLSGPCRTRPVCSEAGADVTCADGQAPVCVLGEVDNRTAPRPDSGTPPTPDSGTPEEDAGTDGGTDAGSTEDAGTDAG